MNISDTVLQIRPDIDPDPAWSAHTLRRITEAQLSGARVGA